MAKMKFVDWLAYILLAIGGINWGIYAVSRWFGNQFDLVQALGNAITPNDTVISGIVFLIVGIAGIYGLIMIPKLAKR